MTGKLLAEETEKGLKELGRVDLAIKLLEEIKRRAELLPKRPKYVQEGYLLALYDLKNWLELKFNLPIDVDGHYPPEDDEYYPPENPESSLDYIGECHGRPMYESQRDNSV